MSEQQAAGAANAIDHDTALRALNEARWVEVRKKRWVFGDKLATVSYVVMSTQHYAWRATFADGRQLHADTADDAKARAEAHLSRILLSTSPSVSAPPRVESGERERIAQPIWDKYGPRYGGGPYQDGGSVSWCYRDQYPKQLADIYALADAILAHPRPAAGAEGLVEALTAVRDRINSPIYGGIDDTFWIGPAETVVDYIDAALARHATPQGAVETAGRIEIAAEAIYKHLVGTSFNTWQDYVVRCPKGADYYRSIATAALAAAPEQAGSREIVRHVKRGTEYKVLFRGVELQVSVARGEPLELLETTLKPEFVCVENDRLVVYLGTDGRLWAREESEFDDGRFVPTAARPSHSVASEGK